MRDFPILQINAFFYLQNVNKNKKRVLILSVVTANKFYLSITLFMPFIGCNRVSAIMALVAI